MFSNELNILSDQPNILLPYNNKGPTAQFLTSQIEHSVSFQIKAGFRRISARECTQNFYNQDGYPYFQSEISNELSHVLYSVLKYIPKM